MIPSEFLRRARRWWWAPPAGAIVAGLISLLVTLSIAPTFQATATLLVNQASSDSLAGVLGGQQLTKTYAELVTTTESLRRANESLGSSDQLSLGYLRDRVSADADGKTQLIRVHARDGQAARAAAIANAVAASFPAYATEAQKGTSPQFISTVFVAELAERPDDPVSPNLPVNVILGAILGLLGAVALVALFEYLNDNITGPADIERIGASVLGSVAHVAPPPNAVRNKWVPSLITGTAPERLTESFRQLQATLSFSLAALDVKFLVVTSANPGEGKSTTAANLAIVLSESGRRVLLIDGDIRKPDAHRYFDIPNSSGLTSAFVRSPSEAPAYVRTISDTLHVLTSGPIVANPTEMLGSRKLSEMLQVLRARFDLVIVDTAPANALADASLWLSHADGVVVVAREGRTRRTQLAETLKRLRGVNNVVLGVVINHARSRGFESYYGKYYYGYRKTEAGKKRRTWFGARRSPRLPRTPSTRAETETPPR